MFSYYKYRTNVKETVILRSCGKVNIMIIIWLLLISSIQGQESKRRDDQSAFQVLNVTTLYPVSKKIKNASSNITKTLDGRTTWKLEATYAETNSEKKTDGKQEETYSNISVIEQARRGINNNITATKQEGRGLNNNITFEDEEEKRINNNNITIINEEGRGINNSITATEQEGRGLNNNKNITISKEEASGNNGCMDFKPSQHLGNFLDEEEFTKTYGVPANVEDPGFQFISLHKKEINSVFKPSPEEIPIPKEFPYKFYNTMYRSKDIWIPDILEPRPTVEIPVRVPAGGLYKLEDPFAVHPSTLHSGFDEEHGLEIKENFKENYIKKRVNPWRNVLRLMTALVPAGLIISALTPSVITVHSTGPEARQRSRFVRRSDTSAFELPTISEQCRFRLLCELHSQDNYKKSLSERRRGTHCYKIQCEDPEAVWRMLHWLLNYHQPKSNDERGRYFT